MAEQITREDALTREGYRHACHIMLYGDSSAKLFGKIPIKHIVLVRKSALTVTYTPFYLYLTSATTTDELPKQEVKK